MGKPKMALASKVAFALSICGIVALPCASFAQDVLPRPEPPFKGVIGETYKDSTPDKIPLIKAPDGAPNVLVVQGCRVEARVAQAACREPV
jgi:arylsulfatase